jgi:GAF domain-containing protein
MVIIRDVSKDPDYQYPDLAKKEGLRSLVAMPLIVKEQVIGVINCYTPSAHELTKEEIQMLSSIAHQAGLAIENTRLAAETLAAQKALETRKLVERAKGILQSEAKLTEEDAYKRIQQQSRRNAQTDEGYCRSDYPRFRIQEDESLANSLSARGCERIDPGSPR